MSTLRLPARADSVMVARRTVAAALERLGVSDDALFAATLVVSELLGNAVRHATPTTVSLHWSVSATTVRIEVCDDLATLPRQAEPARLAEGGRGLRLVDSVARRWGAEVLPGGGKMVWAEISRDG